MASDMEPTVVRDRNGGGSSTTLLHDPWLTIARITWLAVVTSIAILFLYHLVTGFSQLRSVCSAPEGECHPSQLSPELAELNRQLGFSLDFYAWFTTLSYAVFGVVFSVTGWLIFLRRSNDWMALFVGILLILMGAGANPVIPKLGAVFLAIVTPGFVLFFLLFPDGHFAPKWIRWLALGLIIYMVARMFVVQLPVRGMSSGPPSPIIQAGFLMGFASQVYRYLRISTPLQKQQTKWVVFGIGFWVVCLIILVTVVKIVPLNRPNLPSFLLDRYAFVFVGLVPMMAFPVSIGFSILRFRLWDIDLVIRRSLAYSLLTAVLGAGYFVSVFLFQRLLPGQSAITTVASTLLTAALFTPLRHRFQAGIDRRFYRRQYDTEQILAKFGERIREQVELAELAEELITTASGAMQPATISLWLSSRRKRIPKRIPGKHD